MRNGWISLAVFVCLSALVFACGAPEITDLDPNPTNTGTGTQSPTGTITGEPTTPPGTPTPSGSPIGTLPPGVPSFAMWETNVYNVLPGNGQTGNCAACHSGGSGGFAFFKPDGSVSNKKYYWFTSMCNRDTGAPNEGVQAYGATPVGRMVDVMCGQCNDPQCPSGHEGGNPGATACNQLRAWLQTGTIAPPSCSTTYDLDNSQ